MLIKKTKSILNSEQNRPITQLITGASLAQAITIIVSPISTRLYSPEELGIYTLLLTVISLFGPIICGKYDLSIVSAKDEKEAMEIAVASIVFSILLTILITIAYSFYLSSKPNITNKVGIYAYVVILLLLINSLSNVLTSYNNRHKEYKTISSVYVIRTTVQNIGLVSLGLLKLGVIGLLISQLLGSISGFKKQSSKLIENASLLKQVDIKGVKKALINYKNQPLFSMPAHFIGTFSYSIINLFITGLFGLNVFGYYSMAYRMLGLPLSLISMNISKVFFQRATDEMNETGNFFNTLKKITIILSIISVPMIIVLMFLGPNLFELVFGDGWGTAGGYVRILAPMYGIRLVVSALTPALIVAGKQKLEMKIQALFIPCSVIAYVTCKFSNYEIEIFLKIISLTYSIIYIIFFAFIYKLSKKKRLDVC
ncbi:lipopolysaccharide biosynthesis protein [Psychrobacillus sp. BM2]|uniref:lipopolysaccharide biosynthesis protein n=1 Tax=Psychrobacillus sp. BM2 TaxID=3400421 RepID=UPI003B02516C